jgi:O-antigen/teichoic acid export membrane protein
MNLALIPRMGLLGAALAGAAVNAATNLWSLAEVRKSLGIVPSARKYVALVAPTAAMIAMVLLFQHFAPTAWPAWAAVLAGLTIGYLVFAAVSLLALDSDDRVIARIIWTRAREIVGARNGV